MSCNLFNFSTELLIHIFAYLPFTDLVSVQCTCRRIFDIVSGTAQLQLILHMQLNCVVDLLPPNCPFSERLQLLRHHEKAWSNLQFNPYTEFSTNVKPYFCKHILQDSYLIARSNSDLSKYEYVDLLSLSPKEEPEWIHISLKDFLAPYNVEFIVDHNLVVTIRFGVLYYLSDSSTLLIRHREKGRSDRSNRHVQHQFGFFEFTTGMPHPLAPVHTINLPIVDCLGSARVEVDIFGDHILATKAAHRGHSSFYLVSWKTGTVTFVSVHPSILDLYQDWS